MGNSNHESFFTNSLNFKEEKIMDRNEKKEKRSFISQYLDTSNTRLKDDEVDFLYDFINEYDNKYKGKTSIETRRHDGWSSDGKFTRTIINTSTYNDDIGIHMENSYYDDDGQSGNSSSDIKNARGILNWFKEH